MSKIEIVRTSITGAWAFKGRVYANLTNVERTLVRLSGYALNDAKVEALADKIHVQGDIDMFLWEIVQRRTETEEHMPTRDQLITEGKRTKVCQVCHRKLTNPKSVAAGIGPICAGRV